MSSTIETVGDSIAITLAPGSNPVNVAVQLPSSLTFTIQDVAAPLNVSVDANPLINIYLEDTGTQGPQGIPGIDGAPGTGANPQFSFTQLTPTKLWVIDHNLGYWPSIVVHDLAGNEIEAGIENVTVNQMKVRFADPTAGYARLT